MPQVMSIQAVSDATGEPVVITAISELPAEPDKIAPVKPQRFIIGETELMLVGGTPKRFCQRANRSITYTEA